MMYEASLKSIAAHQMPKWYDDAKLGIFVHWGLYSVPAWAEPGDINELIRKIGHGKHLAHNPYAEWYMNTIKFKDSGAYRYHAGTFGDGFEYKDFQAMFEEQAKNMKPAVWADLFKKSGAKYVTMVTKHHDGYALWPSRHKNPAVGGFYSKRNFVGEVADAVRAQGLRMGVYYSGVIDWSVRDIMFKSSYTALKSYWHDRDYIDYAQAQYKELIDDYRPCVLWNDIGYPAEYDLNKLFAYYYNRVEDGVINDRWEQYHISRNPLLRSIVRLACWVIDKRTKGIEFGNENGKRWYDFSTAEYCPRDQIASKKWEMVRGIGYSFGYNRMETPEHMLDGKSLIHLLLDVVSKNGNLCINVGPRPDGTIPDLQAKPLLELGEWLETNGECIYATRPFAKPASVTGRNVPVRFTRKDDDVYAVVMGGPEPEVVIKDFEIPSPSRLTIVGGDSELAWAQTGRDLSIKLPEKVPTTQAYAVKVHRKRI